MFETALHEAVDRAQVGLTAARRGDRPDEQAAHSARLLDLLDRAHANHVDVVGWVPQEVLTSARATAGHD